MGIEIEVSGAEKERIRKYLSSGVTMKLENWK